MALEISIFQDVKNIANTVSCIQLDYVGTDAMGLRGAWVATVTRLDAPYRQTLLSRGREVMHVNKIFIVNQRMHYNIHWGDFGMHDVAT